MPRLGQSKCPLEMRDTDREIPDSLSSNTRPQFYDDLLFARSIVALVIGGSVAACFSPTPGKTARTSPRTASATSATPGAIAVGKFRFAGNPRRGTVGFRARDEVVPTPSLAFATGNYPFTVGTLCGMILLESR